MVHSPEKARERRILRVHGRVLFREEKAPPPPRTVALDGVNLVAAWSHREETFFEREREIEGNVCLVLRSVVGVSGERQRTIAGIAAKVTVSNGRKVVIFFFFLFAVGSKLYKYK